MLLKFCSFPKYYISIIEEPFLGNFVDDEPLENLRVSSSGKFGMEDFPWATLFEVRIEYQPHGLKRQAQGIGNVFSIRIKSPGFVEEDLRFVGKIGIEMRSFDQGLAIRKIREIVEGSNSLPFDKAMKYLERYFFVSEI